MWSITGKREREEWLSTLGRVVSKAGRHAADHAADHEGRAIAVRVVSAPKTDSTRPWTWSSF